MEKQVPDYLTHYYLPERGPFLSISYLEGEELEKVIRELKQMCEAGQFRRGIADWYIEERKSTEEFLKEEFRKKGGKIEIDFPHYFVLGSSRMQKSMAPGTEEVRINLSEVPKEFLSFTYPDSIASRVLCKDDRNRRPFHGQVFTLDEILDIIDSYGFPEDKVEEVDGIRFPLFIEAQLWSTAPIKDYLRF